MADEDLKYYIDPQEFTEQGYLQEVNRRFFHPLGLAMEVIPHADGWRFGGIRDHRDDIEGVYFAKGVIDADKAATVDAEIAERTTGRKGVLGYIIQPVQEDTTT